ncbi:MAG: glycyl radical protein [Candidatus Thorarchaeota archaeon]
MTERTMRMRQRVLDAMPTLSAERARLFTEYVSSHLDQPAVVRMAGAFAHVVRNMTIRIEPEELIVGNMGPTPRSCQVFPEYSWEWIDRELDRLDKRRTERFHVSEEDKATLREVFKFWRGRSTAEVSSTRIPPESLAGARAGLYTIGAPGTGIGHVTVDYRRVLNEGLNSIIREARERREQCRSPSPESDFYTAVEISLEAAIEFAHRFSLLARELAVRESDPERRRELLEISRICSVVPASSATSFHEALQSFWFVHLLVQTESNGHSISTGRFDQYMLPFYERDLREGRITRQRALELLEMLWIKLSSLIKLRDEYYSVAFAGFPMFQNLTIGGQDREGRDSCNAVTELVLEATANVRMTQPTVSFRWHEGTPDNMMARVVDVVSRGLGMPGLFNDHVIIPMMVEKGTDPQEAHDYSILGCVEPIIEGKTDARPNIGYVNLPKIMEVTLNNGTDPRTGLLVGKRTGDPREFSEFSQLWNAFEEQVDHAIELLTRADRVAASVHAELAPTPFVSALLDGCISTGRTMQEGGARYNSGGIMGVGIAIVADSMEIVRSLVFEQGRVRMDTLLDALSRNFEGYEDLRVRLENYPVRYGNDIERVDLLARRVGEAFCRSVQSRMTTRGGPYHAGLFSVSMYIPMGDTLGATPDGRKAGMMLSDGVSPARNKDVNGPTAAMKSVSRLNHSLAYNGTLYNMKFTPDIFVDEENRRKFAAMIEAYFRLGGLHVQFNVVSREMLEEAKKNPAQYRNLIVRVAGFSAYFVELDPFVQDEIIARTEFSAR